MANRGRKKARKTVTKSLTPIRACTIISGQVWEENISLVEKMHLKIGLEGGDFW
jgi:hypothetical protein